MSGNACLPVAGRRTGHRERWHRFEVPHGGSSQCAGDDPGEHEGNRASPQGRGGARTATRPASPRAGAVGSSSTIRASPMSRNRRLTSRSRHRAMRCRTDAGVDAGKRRPVDVLAQDRRERVGNIVALERALARQHFVEHAAERPHVAPLVGLASLRLFGTHVGGGAENHAHLSSRACDRRRRRDVARLPPPGSNAFASPKSSTFTVPSGRTLMLAGLRSRWMIPCSCAASSASAICFAIGNASSSRNRRRARCAATDPRPRRVPSRGP